MKEIYTDIMSLRRRVFAEVARIAYADAPLEELETAGYRLFPNLNDVDRTDIFRQRAIAEEMLRLAMGMSIRQLDEYEPVTAGFDDIDMDVNVFETPLVDVIKFACEACPTKQHKVTDNCRTCMARPCVNVCPVNAVSMGKDRAVIDHDKCINCGQCKRACPYSAIVSFDRPCAAACGVNAIESDENNLAQINHDKCVACGRCVTECPFGAIGDKTQIYQLVKALKSKRKIYAIVAPSFVGQFGLLTTPDQLETAIKTVGFEDMVEVGLGADMTTLHEAKEFVEKVPNEIPWMGTSCCHSWTLLIEYNFPELVDQVSDSGSPMKYTAEYIKEKDPDAMVCFVGPCTSKKVEAISTQVKDYVDFVITFEELMGIFVAEGVEPSEMPKVKKEEEASRTARGYAEAGGVAKAVEDAIKELNPELEVKMEGANSLQECKKLIQLAKAGKRDGYLLEGMACPGGCVSGMGTLISLPRVKKALKEYMNEAEYKTPFENELIPEELK